MKWSISCLALWRLVQGWIIYDLLSQTTPVKPMLLQKADQCNSQDGCHAQPPPQMRSWRHSQSSEPCAQGQCQGHLAKGGMGQFTTRPWKGRWVQGDWGNFHVNFNIYFKHVAVSNKVKCTLQQMFFFPKVSPKSQPFTRHTHVLKLWCTDHMYWHHDAFSFISKCHKKAQEVCALGPLFNKRPKSLGSLFLLNLLQVANHGPY